MKRFRFLQPLLPLLLLLAACDDFSLFPASEEEGELRWVLDRSILTKSTSEIPDTNDFILTVRDARGAILYEGSYGDSPEFLRVNPGSYTVGVVSIPFSAPAFDRPQYGDEQVVLVPEAAAVVVKLNCTLLNAGIRLSAAAPFVSAYPDGVLYVTQEKLKLPYGYSEKRIAYTMPGDVSVILNHEGRDETLFTRTLAPRQILSVNLSVSGQQAQGSGSISVAVDTSKNWTGEDIVLGGQPDGPSGDAWKQALSVADAAAHAGQNSIWVYGYIVGGDLTSAGQTVKTSGCSKNTHLALADRSSVSVKASCLAVELPKGAVRDALNLVDHPELVGRRVYVKGNLVQSYFGTLGMKSTREYRF